VLSVEGDPAKSMRLTLWSPEGEGGGRLVVDLPRFEAIWAGDVIMLQRHYKRSDETQPFSIRLITAMIFRERRLAQDIVAAALVLGLLGLAPIMFWQLLSDKMVFYRADNTFTLLCLVMLVTVLFEGAFSYLRQLLVNHLTQRLDIKLSTYVFDKMLNLPIEVFEQNVASLLSRNIGEVFRIRAFLVGQLFGAILDSTTLWFFLPVMFLFSPIMTIVVLAFAWLIAVWLILTMPGHRKRWAAVAAAESAQGAFLAQSVNGIRTIKSLALDRQQRQMWDVLVERLARARVAEGTTSNTIQAVALPLERLAVYGSYALGVFLVLSSYDAMHIGALFAFLMLSQRVLAPLLKVAQLINQYSEVRGAVAAVGKLVNQAPEEGRSGSGVVSAIRGEVAFSGVTFKYKGATTLALNDVTFEAAPGHQLGIVGRSGSGKTTITRLLQRLHADYGGLIKIDGIDVREYEVEHLRRNIGVVSQDNFLFSGTIRANITVAKPDASLDEVVRAAMLAGADEFIEKLPRRYETYIQEGAPNLSGGQRQCLAIARALIVDPPILILDGATSALDAVSEAIVNVNISRIARERTLIIISQRLVSLVNCDAIVVLDGGAIEDIGRHEQLVERNDIYRGLWYQQNQYAMGPVRRSPSLVSKH